MIKTITETFSLTSLLIFLSVLLVFVAIAFIVMHFMQKKQRELNTKTTKKDYIKKTKQLNNKIKRNSDRVQDFLGIKSIEENHLLKTNGQEIYYFAVQPTNISVLSSQQKGYLIRSLANVLSQIKSIEILCTDSSQSYDDNVNHLIELSKNEKNPYIKALDEKDIEHLDAVRSNTTTSRVFYLIVRCNSSDSPIEKNRFISTVTQICKEHKLQAKLAGKEEIKKLIAIYLEQNVYQDPIEDFDGQAYIESLSAIDEPDIKNFVDLVAPSIMNFKHSNYYIVGNTYRTVCAIRTYITQTQQQALLKALGEKEGVTLHIYNRIVNPAERKKIIDNAERASKSKVNNSSKMSEATEGIEGLKDLQHILSSSYKTNEMLLHCAVYIEAMAYSYDDLKVVMDSVLQVLVDARLTKDSLLLQQRDGFTSVAPFGQNMFKTEFERILPATSVANLYPFSYSGLTDPHGNLIGKDVNGSNILIDFDRRQADKTNGHIAIFGNSGEGKSWLTKLQICNFRQAGKKLYSIDVESEFFDVTTNLGGTNVDMMTGKYYINVLEPKLLKNEGSETDNDIDLEVRATSKVTLLSQHIAFLRDFFHVYKPEFSDTLLDILELMLVKTYETKNITTGTNLKRLSSKDYPRLQDLYTVVEKELNNYDKQALDKSREMIYRKEDLQRLLLALESICVGNDSMYFNGYTNIPNADHINFGIQDMLNTNENLKNAMYLNIFSFMQHKYFAEGNTVVICDEIHEIIKSFIVVLYIRSFIKRGRKRDSNIVIASQNLEDLMLPDIISYTKPLFSIPTHRFLFFPGNVDSEEFMRVANIAPNEYALIDSPNQGFCLLCSGDDRFHCHVIAPKHKSVLFGTAGGK